MALYINNKLNLIKNNSYKSWQDSDYRLFGHSKIIIIIANFPVYLNFKRAAHRSLAEIVADYKTPPKNSTNTASF